MAIKAKGHGRGKGEGQVTGGTGRFRDVSGTWTEIDHNTPTPSEAFPSRGTSRIKGHISY
jgi:hypothetical protein